MNVNGEAGLRMQIAELQSHLEESERHVVELKAGLAHIIWVLKEKQPNERHLSVYYTAGYARAMDDMRVAILAAVSKETVTTARELRTGFTERARALLDSDVARRAVVEDADRPEEVNGYSADWAIVDEVAEWDKARCISPAGPFSDVKTRISYWPINDGAWPLQMDHGPFTESEEKISHHG